MKQKWEYMFACAREYLRVHGDVNIPHNYIIPSGEKLGFWLGAQRQAYKKGVLSSARQARLESIGVIWDAQEEAWEKMFSLAQAYVQEHWDLNVHQFFKAASGENLGAWISTQRRAYFRGKLSAERQSKLESIGMIWDARNGAWEKMLDCAKDYWEEHGNLDVPLGYQTASGQRLGIWINDQRRSYKNGTLPQDRYDCLTSIGMVWPVYDGAWGKMYELAREYFLTHGNLEIPGRFQAPSGEKLGAWIRTQRYAYNDGSLTAQRQSKLESIGMIWDVYDDAWEKMFALAEEYFRENGHLRVPCSFKLVSGEELGMWLVKQRQVYKDNTLTKERQARLESISMVWDLYDDAWEKMFALAEEYVRERGNLRVKQGFVTPSGEKLGAWISAQRRAHNDGTLSAQRQARLWALGMIWDAQEDAWEKMFLCAQTYWQEKGNLQVPMNYRTGSGENLRAWINTQRCACKAGKLSREKQEKLASIGFAISAYGAAWEQMFALAAEYFAEHGNLDVPQAYKPTDGKNLGSWIGEQRRAYKNKKLSIVRQERLESIGMKWRAR